jgi:hypothetical protein
MAIVSETGRFRIDTPWCTNLGWVQKRVQCAFRFLVLQAYTLGDESRDGKHNSLIIDMDKRLFWKRFLFANPRAEGKAGLTIA